MRERGVEGLRRKGLRDLRLEMEEGVRDLRWRYEEEVRVAIGGLRRMKIRGGLDRVLRGG